MVNRMLSSTTQDWQSISLAWRKSYAHVSHALWAMVCVSFGYDLLRAAHHESWDLFPVWSAVRAFLHGQSPYAVHLFVYPPSVLLVLAPLGLANFDKVALGFLLVDALAVVLAILLCLRLCSLSWRSRTGCLVFLVMSLVLPVHDTLSMHNVNGVLVAAEAGALLAASRRHWLLAGALLGITFEIKPVVIPLILLLILWRKWGAASLAVAIPTILSAIALPLSHHGSQFFTLTVPFLLKGNAANMQNVNVSLAGAVAMLGWPAALSTTLRIVTLGVVGLLVWERRRAAGDEATRLAEISGLILLATFLDFSFSWGYYSIYLLPLLVSAARPQSLLRRRITWLGIFCIGCPLTLWPRIEPLGSTFAEVRITFGYLLLLAAMGIAIWTLNRRGENGAFAGASGRGAGMRFPQSNTRESGAPPRERQTGDCSNVAATPSG